MLHLYLDEIPCNLQDSLVNDVEEQFAKLSLKCSDKEKELVEKIEKGNLIDGISFVDRFGYKLYTTELSTGCKAALCVLNSPNNIINLVECGLNARDIIISLCNTGSVLVDSNTISISTTYSTEEVSVELEGYIFKDISRLNRYIFNERPFEPDMSDRGIIKKEGI